MLGSELVEPELREREAHQEACRRFIIVQEVSIYVCLFIHYRYSHSASVRLCNGRYIDDGRPHFSFPSKMSSLGS